MRVFVTGGTGLIGVRLVRALRRRGDEVVVLSRRPGAWQRVGPDVATVAGDPTAPGPWQDRLAECKDFGPIPAAGVSRRSMPGRRHDRHRGQDRRT